MDKINILTLGDFKFHREVYAMNYKDIDFIYSIASCKLTKRAKELFSIEAKRNKRKIKLLPHKKIKSLSFFRDFNLDTLEPLSNKLIYDNAICQIETLKMYDRITPLKPGSYENRYKHFYLCMRFFNSFLDNANIKAYLRYSIPHMGYDNVIYHLCKYKGIKTYMTYFIHPHWCYIQEDYENPFPDFKYVYDRDFIIPRIKDMFIEYWNKKPLSYKPIVIPAGGRGKVLQVRRERTKRDLLYYYHKLVNHGPNLKIPYVYVPLHFQFEGTTNPLGNIFCNQILMIEILSKTGLKIYVKEHPRISSNRSEYYYKKISKLENVELIPIEFDNLLLIENCFAVATITGTAGFEATLKGRPCLLFGHIYYQYAPYCFKTQSLNEVMEAIEIIKNMKVEKKEIEAFLKGLENYLIPLNYKSIANAFNKVLEDYKNEES